MVIADFYIPYICCSDCPPVAYILPPPPKEESADPTISIDTNSFCSDDKTKFPIHITPAGGEVSGTGVSVLADGKYVFVPAAAGVGLHTITYTVNGKTVTVQVEVVQMPVAKFSVATREQNGQLTITLTNTSTNATVDTTYKWLLNGEMFSEKKDPEPFSIPVQSLPRSIVLQASNGGCVSEASEEIRFDAENKEMRICANLGKLQLEPQLSPNDVVEVVFNDGIKMENAALVVFPAETNVSQPTTFHVSYAFNGRQVNAAISLVFVNPDFNISIQQSVTNNQDTIALTLESKDKSYTSVEWNISPRSVTGAGGPFADDPLTLQFTPSQIREARAIRIIHSVFTDSDSGECRFEAQFEISFIQLDQALQKASFDNHFAFEN